MGAILLQNVGGTAWCETNIFIQAMLMCEVLSIQIPNLVFRGVLKATLITLCFILLTSNFNRFNLRFE